VLSRFGRSRWRGGRYRLFGGGFVQSPDRKRPGDVPIDKLTISWDVRRLISVRGPRAESCSSEYPLTPGCKHPFAVGVARKHPVRATYAPLIFSRSRNICLSGTLEVQALDADRVVRAFQISMTLTNSAFPFRKLWFLSRPDPTTAAGRRDA
jgi:hypothetical protein